LRLNTLISGGTGTGKTTFLNALSAYIPESERIVTIEDPTELKLQQPHVVSLEARPPNIDGKGEITQRDLLRNTLRMRPDRIIIGEVRGSEAFDMLNAMNTGHEGSLSTVHANSPRDALARVENMVLMANLDLPDRAIREQVSSALHLMVQLVRFTDGVRRVTHVTEITGMEGQVITMQDLFQFKQTGVDPEGRVLGHMTATGLRPSFADRFAMAGIQLPENVFLARTGG
jgi:pilus assembly protein CpaF